MKIWLKFMKTCHKIRFNFWGGGIWDTMATINPEVKKPQPYEKQNKKKFHWIFKVFKIPKTKSLTLLLGDVFSIWAVQKVMGVLAQYKHKVFKMVTLHSGIYIELWV